MCLSLLGLLEDRTIPYRGLDIVDMVHVDVITCEGVSIQTNDGLFAELFFACSILRVETHEQKKERIKERALKLQSDRQEECQNFVQEM